MKPITLDMTAFGSYVKLEEPIDFRKLDHSLYLITGDTGAGKTTIFDGIMFALYGVASGGVSSGKQEKRDGKFRTFEMMHCDHVDRSVDTVVRLTFEHMGKVHTVERVLHFQKEQKTGSYNKTVLKAKFWEEDKSVIEKPNEVTKRITELLGMNAGQFRKIVMLAQGEFKRFLDADSEEKNEILGDLFDSSAYVYFQDVLDKARTKLEQHRRTEGTDRINRAMEGFILPEGIREEESEIYTAGHSRLEEALCRLVENDQKLKEDLEGEIKTDQEQEKKLHIKFGKAEEHNKKLDELDEKEQHLKKLLSKRSEMEQLKDQKNKIDKVFYKIRPEEQLFILAEKAYSDVVKEIESLEKTLGELEQEKKTAEEQLERCEEENEPVVTRLEAEIKNIEEVLPEYGKLERKCQEQLQNDIKKKRAEKQRQVAENNKKQTVDNIRDLERQREKLDGIDGTVERLRGKLEIVSGQTAQLTDKNGVKEQVDNIHRKEKELKKEQTALRKIIEEAGSLEMTYHELYQAFIKGQAGVLAKNLEEELNKNKEAVCPVCKTVFHGHPSYSFAELVEGIPEQEEVDRAKAEYDKKEKKRRTQEEKVIKLKENLNVWKDQVVDEVRKLQSDCQNWEILDHDDYLERMIAVYETKKQEVKTAYEEARSQRESLVSLKKSLCKKNEEMERHERALETCKKQEQAFKEEGIKLDTEIKELKKALKYPDKKSAEEQKRQWEDEKEERKGEIKRAAESYNKAMESYKETSGALRTNQKKRPKLEKEKEKAADHLKEAMAACGFQNQEEVHEMLHLAGETDSAIENWLTSKEKEIRNYQNDLTNTEERIKELKQETEGLEKIDLKQLNDAIKNLEKERESVEHRLSECKTQYQNHRNTAKDVEEASQELRKTESAWRRLDVLADLATGKKNAEGGKLSFDRYVMGYVFREVLEMANQHLDIMSGGRYELIHETNTKYQSSKAGLEILVRDMTTGKDRSSASLSGGESFFVSLALALGLSDIVHNHAGGKQLDALFIDEGFGSLDSDVLDRALSVLNQLTEGRRLVGIISHVAKLEESIPQQIKVRNSEKGSTLEIVN